MLIVLTALVYLFNSCLGIIHFGGETTTLQKYLDVFCTHSMVNGFPSSEIAVAGSIMGTKLY